MTIKNKFQFLCRYKSSNNDFDWTYEMCQCLEQYNFMQICNGIIIIAIDYHNVHVRV